MLIVLEGPDCAGKTTLANALAASLGQASIIHRGPPTGHPLDEWVRPLEDYVPGGSTNIVCDRWHLGEAVYGPMKRGTSILDTASWTYIDMFLKSRGAYRVLIDATDPELLQTHQERGETFVTPDELVQIADWYRREAGDGWHRHHRALVSHMALVNSAASLAYNCQPLAAFTTYVGSRRPKVLVLGEKRGPTNKGRTAFMPYLSSSGRYLFEACPWLGLGEVGIANALEESVPDLWAVLDRPKIVTLGKPAHDKLQRLHVPHGAVPHPQYVRRFHHNRKGDYGRLLLDAAFNQEVHTTWPQ